ncbi:MAG TPA: hypothetical protein PKA82_09730 [Pyrinomonadaceae bacterium]|nr:hypothetical protein [Pyrinomonadaceae bacterium]
MNDIAPKLPSHGQFSAVANTHFRTTFGDGLAVTLSLVSVSELTDNSVTQSFSLIFLAPPTEQPTQSIYTLSHDTLGEMELFLVPVKRDADGVYFESVFSNFV